MYNKFLLFYFLITLVLTVGAIPWGNDDHEKYPSVGQLLVRKDEREQLVLTEYGDISVVEIGDVALGQGYHLQFITLEPNALFLPVLLHADMLFYVQSGEGRLSWGDEDSMRHVKLRRGDLYTLRPGTIFTVHSNLADERQKLRLCAVFINPIHNQHEPSKGAYSSIRDIVLGFDKQVLQAAFQVPKEIIEELTSGTKQPAIVHAPTTEKKHKSLWEIDSEFMDAFLGRKGYNIIFDSNKKKSKTKAFNLYDQKPDVKNRHGQSLIVNRKNLPALKGPNLSIFMVNLTGDSMMGPHWNPVASEVSIVLQGEGMVRIVGPSAKNESDNSSQNTRFKVEEGDVFVVPRFHPMAQMAFANGSFVFIGFSTTTKKNYPQFLMGKASVLRTLDREIVAASFGVTNTSTIDRFLDQQGDSVILECASCAGEELRKLKEEMERKREEEEKRRQEEEEEERKRKEEERKKQEEEEAKWREEEARKRREEEAREEEETAKKEEEERKHREEEEAREREEEEERRHKQEEEEERQEEEERARRQKEEEEAKRREEEARKKREEAAKREEEAARRQEEEREEEAKKQEEEEQARRAEEEEEETKEEEEERARKEEERREEEEQVKRQEEEEEAKRREKEAREKRKEAARREEEEARKKEEMREEEAKRQEEEEEAKRIEEEEEEKRRAREQEEEEAGRGTGERERSHEEEREMKKEEGLWYRDDYVAAYLGL